MRLNDARRLNREGVPRGSRKQSYTRARNKLINSIHANAGKHLDASGKPYIPLFVTLTYSEPSKDIKTCNNDVRLFIKRLNHQQQDSLKYHIVPELTKNRNIHYHMIVYNKKYIPVKELQACWRLGGVHIEQIRNISGIAVYLTKGFNSTEENIITGKRYWGSRGLFKPVEILGIDLELPEEALNKKVYYKTYDNEYRGKISYTCYNLKKKNTPPKISLEEKALDLEIPEEIVKEKIHYKNYYNEYRDKIGFSCYDLNKKNPPPKIPCVQILSQPKIETAQASGILQSYCQYRHQVLVNIIIELKVTVLVNKYRKLILRRSRHGP